MRWSAPASPSCKRSDMRTPVFFEGMGCHFYERGEFRTPRKGEFYLSGAIVAAYRASHDMTSPYRIAIPTTPAKLAMVWQERK